MLLPHKPCNHSENAFNLEGFPACTQTEYNNIIHTYVYCTVHMYNIHYSHYVHTVHINVKYVLYIHSSIVLYICMYKMHYNIHS